MLGHSVRSDEDLLQKKEIFLRIADKCAYHLKKNYNVKRVFLIGSLVRGIFHDGSDIDIVVEGLPDRLYIKALTDLYDILNPGVELNLIPFEDAFDSLKQKTLNEGKLLYA